MKLTGLGDPNEELTELAKWEAEYQQIQQSQREAGETIGGTAAYPDFDYAADIQNGWKGAAANLNSDMSEGLPVGNPTFDERGEPILPEYRFGECEPFVFTSLLKGSP